MEYVKWRQVELKRHHDINENNFKNMNNKMKPKQQQQ